MEKIKTLLVDDHKIVRDGIKMILNSAPNIEVTAEASNGVDALKYLENNNNIDVVLMDISMTELNGVDATEIIKKLYSKINILALTMHSEESYISKMMNAGALGYVLKDISSENLIDAVKTVAEGKNYYCNSVSNTIISKLLNPSNSNKHQKTSILSKREISVLKEVTKGISNIEIAKVLEISNRTVETHRRNILKKLGLKNTAEMITYAIKNGYVE
ncbi:MAG: response regulator transcription factor [Flavobacteriales bacterium]|nr:response regulator transcription factor [Flavobacteriales bacterium]